MRMKLGIIIIIIASIITWCLMSFMQKKQRQVTAVPSAPVMHHNDTAHAATSARPWPGTVRNRMRQYSKVVRACWKPHFNKRGIAYPPARALFLGIKDAKILQVYAAKRNGGWIFIRSDPILAASGELGHKLREGDCQVPEGRYLIDLLNPNSSYHLSLRVNYPNAFDKRMALHDRRKQLGGDIMFHGNNVSAGCLAMGDAVAEDLFILAADTGIANTKVFITPVDFRLRNLPADMPPQPAWTTNLYAQLQKEMQFLPLPALE